MDAMTASSSACTYSAIHLQRCLQAILAAKLHESTLHIASVPVSQNVSVSYLHMSACV